jgi:hypothetical protein
VLAALFLGQFLSERAFSLVLAFFGIAAWTLLTAFALIVARLARTAKGQAGVIALTPQF